MARNEKRRQDGRRILKRQDQPEAEISPVSTEQDDTTAPPTGEIATVASRTKEDEKPAWSPKLLSKRTWLTDTCNALQTMQQALTDRLVPSYKPRVCSLTTKATDKDEGHVIVDIGLISAAGFHLNYQDPGATIFSITLEEIDREIQD